MNRWLALSKRSVPYMSILRPYTGSVLACLLFQQLDHWFDSHPDGFYKFMSKPEAPHPKYKKGDSWEEELGFSPDEFRSAFDKIGVRYKSKSEFDYSGDKFQGKYFCSYTDKIQKVTWYYRNHELADQLFSHILLGKADPFLPQMEIPISPNEPIPPKWKSQSPQMENPISRDGQSQSPQMENPIPNLYTKTTTDTTYRNYNKDNTPLTPQGEFVEVEIPFSDLDWYSENPEPENLEPIEPTPLSREIQETSALARNSSGVQISPAAKKSKPTDADFNIFCDRWNEQKGTWAGCELSKVTGTFSPKRLTAFRKAWQEHGDQLMDKFDLACEFIRTNQWHIDNPFSIDTLLVVGNITKYADKALIARQSSRTKSIKDKSFAEVYLEIKTACEAAEAAKLNQPVGAVA